MALSTGASSAVAGAVVVLVEYLCSTTWQSPEPLRVQEVSGGAGRTRRRHSRVGGGGESIGRGCMLEREWGGMRKGLVELSSVIQSFTA